MAGMDSQHGSAWSYRDASGSSSYTISSSSGTISTAYTSATGSHMSLVEAATHLDGVVWEQIVDKKGHVEGLAQEFFAGNDDIRDRVLERWFTELGVGWVRPAGELGHTPTNAARSWILALLNILLIWKEELAVPKSERQVDRVQFARFILKVMLRMSSFVDLIVALNHPTIYGMLGLREKLEALLQVHRILSIAEMDPSSGLLVSKESKRIQGQMASLWSEKNGKAREAIWTTMEEIWDRIQKSMEDSSSSWLDSQGSSGIHRATLSLTPYIKLLYTHRRSVTPIVSQAASLGKYVTRIANNDPFASLIMEMTSILDEKLAQNSQNSLLFPDKSLRFLFLLNNSYFIWKEFHELPVFIRGSVHSKIEDYIQSYLQESWEPVLSCLSSPPLGNFEFKFESTYNKQKLWKVPDPMMRGRLRKAIAKRVAPGYRKYLEDNSITTPKIPPEELEGMLQELFEG